METELPAPHQRIEGLLAQAGQLDLIAGIDQNLNLKTTQHPRHEIPQASSSNDERFLGSLPSNGSTTRSAAATGSANTAISSDVSLFTATRLRRGIATYSENAPRL